MSEPIHLMSLEGAKALAETFALICAGGFFLYKVGAGYHHTEMALGLSSQRIPLPDGGDLLIIKAVFKRGERGSLRIHDAQVSLKWAGKIQKTLPLIGIHRLKEGKEKLGAKVRGIIVWDDLPNQDAPLLRLPPKEETEFSCCWEVPRNAICTIELAVLGREWGWFAFGQWKASHVSPPEDFDEKQEKESDSEEEI